MAQFIVLVLIEVHLILARVARYFTKPLRSTRNLQAWAAPYDDSAGSGLCFRDQGC